MSSSRAPALVALVCLVSAGCASVQELTRELPGAKRVKYAVARVNQEQRANLERGLIHLGAGEYRSAVSALRQAMWDVEQIDPPWLRLEELVEVHDALADAYAGLGKKPWSDEHRALARALADQRRRGNESESPEKALARAKSAYQAAHFREAVTAFGHALVELEGVSPTPVRLRSLEDARCHLVRAYFALGQPERAAEEARHLVVRGATAWCRRQSPPPIQELIRAAETGEARSGRRSAD